MALIDGDQIEPVLKNHRGPCGLSPCKRLGVSSRIAHKSLMFQSGIIRETGYICEIAP